MNTVKADAILSARDQALKQRAEEEMLAAREKALKERASGVTMQDWLDNNSDDSRLWSQQKIRKEQNAAIVAALDAARPEVAKQQAMAQSRAQRVYQQQDAALVSALDAARPEVIKQQAAATSRARRQSQNAYAAALEHARQDAMLADTKQRARTQSAVVRSYGRAEPEAAYDARIAGLQAQRDQLALDMAGYDSAAYNAQYRKADEAIRKIDREMQTLQRQKQTSRNTGDEIRALQPKDYVAEGKQIDSQVAVLKAQSDALARRMAGYDTAADNEKYREDEQRKAEIDQRIEELQSQKAEHREDRWYQTQQQRLEALGPGTAQQLYGLYETWYDYDATDPAQVRRHDSMINQNLADAKRQAQTILEQNGLSGDALREVMAYLEMQWNAGDAALRAQAINSLTSTAGGSVFGTAASVPLNLVSGLGYLDAFRQYFGNAMRGLDAPIDLNTDMQTMAGLSRQIRGNVTQNIQRDTEGWIGSDVMGANVYGQLYNTGLSIADSALSMAVGGELGGLLLSMSASAQGVKDAKERGATDGQAVLLGFLNGAAEMIFETISIERLLSEESLTSVREIVLSSLKQAGTEASEEVFTTLANTLADAIFMGDKAELVQDIRQYGDKQGWINWLQGLMWDGIGGAISGGLMSAGNNARIVAGDIRTGRSILQDGTTQKVLELAKELDTDIYLAAIRAGDNPTARQAGALYRNVLQQATESGGAEALRQMDAAWRADTETAAEAEEKKRRAAQETMSDGMQTNIPAPAAEAAAGAESVEQVISRGLNDAGRNLIEQNYGSVERFAQQTEELVRAGRVGEEQLSLILSNAGEVIDAIWAAEQLTDNNEQLTESAARETTVQQTAPAEIDPAAQERMAAVRQVLRQNREQQNAALAEDGTIRLPRVETETQTQEQPVSDGLPTLRRNRRTTAQQNTVAQGTNEGYNTGEGVTANGRTGEDVLLPRSGERNDSARTGGQAGELAGRAGQDTGGYAGRQNTGARPADGGAADLTYGAEMSSASMGVPRGSMTDAVRRVTGGKPTRAVRAAQKLCRENGLELVLFGGDNLHIAGIREGVRGCIVGGKMYVRVDHPLYTAEQIARHELGHRQIDSGRISAKTVRERIEELYTKAGVRAVAEQYASAYAGMTADEAWIEMICDSLGDMNVFAERGSSAAAPYQEMLQKIRAEAEASASTERGPPASTGGVQTSRETEKGGIEDGGQEDNRRNGRRTHNVGRETVEQSNTDFRRNERVGLESRVDQGRGRETLWNEDSEGQRISREDAEKLKNTAVVDKKGRPLAVYHATDRHFDRFAKGDIGFHFGTIEQALKRAKDKGIEKPILVRAYQVIRNPAVVSRDPMSWHVGAAALTLWADGFISDAELAEIKGMVKEGLEYGSPATVRLREMLAEKGYDGIAYPNGFEGEGLSYIALYDSQIIRVPASESASTDHQGGVTQHFSREADADYLSAVENGDMDKAQRMVDEAAQVAGYDTPRLYHGTNGFGFTEFDLERGEQLIFATSDRNVAQTYSGETERRRISERATINVDSLQGETLLQAAQEKLSKYEGYELLTEAEKQNAARENRRSISGILQKAADFVNDNEGAFDSEKMAVMDDMLNALSDISEAQTDDALDEAWNRWTDKLWDLKWMDESVTEELLKAIDSRELMFQKNQLHDFLYGGDIFCQRGTYGFSYVFDNQVALELDAALHMGVYEMYGRGGNQLVIDADGSNWNQIRPPEELNLYGPQKTRDIAAAAKANGYDSVLIRDLRDSGGGMNYNYPSDIYIFFDANQVKSADPVTYDDDGNVIPISKRFNPEERDIRWSLDLNDRDERSVQRENERLERTLRETFPLPRNAGSGTREMLDSITTQIIENGGVTDEALDEAFRYLMENSRFTIDPAPELRDAAERYKGMRIYVPEGVKAELGDDWNSLRRQALGQGVYFVTQEGVNTTSIEDMDLDAIPGYTTAGGADYRAALQGIVDTVRGSRARQMTGNDYLREVGQTQGRETEDAVREELRRQSDAAITDHADGVLEVLQPRTRSEELDRLTALEPEENRAEERRENRPVETRDLDDYFRLLAQTAGALAQIDYDGRDLITSEDGEKRKGLKRTVSEAWHYFQRKMVDAGEAVTRIGRAVRDPHLYHYYNMARASANAAISMIENSATDIRGRKTGKGLNEIFSAIRKQGDAYYDDFQMYMYHLHNIDRMSRYSQGEVDRARGEFEAFQAMNPELLGYADYQIERMAQDDTSELYFEAQEYIRLRDAMRKAENTVDKPVFGYEVGADESRAIVRKLGTAHPEFEQYAQDVYDYIDNLMQYRVDSGLITDEDYDRLTEIYPHYVPTFRIFEDDGTGRTAKNSVRIGKTIGRAEGSSERLMPLHKALAQQTLSVVREGSKNRFGQRLLDSGADRIQGAKEHVRSIDEYKGSFSEDTFDKGEETDELFRKTNTFIVRQGGKMYEMTISPALYEAVKALSPDSTEANAFTRVVRAGNDLFKRLVTGDNPVFLVRNFMRDLQDVGLYSKDLSAFAAQYPQAVAEIAKNGAYWQMYKALGGTYSSFFDYETGNVDRGSWLKRNTMNRVEALNEAIEQAPRLAEFMATVKKKGGLDADMDTLMEAMYNAAEVTVNFGRSGTLGKVLNANYVPFLNPGIQGFSKMIRTITETRGAKNWARLAVKAAALGIAPALLNALLYRDDDEWDELKDRDKDIYYLFKLKDGLWLKLPKGRTLSVLGGLATRGVQLAKGEDVDWGGFFSTAVSQTAPANPLSENILKAWFDADLFNRESTGRTWYGTSIESQRLQNLAPGERYDASTDVLSKWLGKTFNLSPKKINYLLDQYTGVIGDIALPWMATAARKGMFQSAFTLDSTVSNELSGEFYDKADELNYQKNGGDATGVDKIVYRFWSKQSSGVSDINAMIREIEADASLSNKEKQELLHEQYRLRNGAERNALDILDEYTAAAQRWYDAASDIEDEDDRIDYAYRETNREIFGAEYALKTYNKSVYETAQAMNAGGDISYEQFYDLYFRMKQADNELTGYEKSNAKRDAIRESDLDDVQKALMYRKYISDSRDDDIIAFTNAGMSMDDFLRAQNEYSTVGNEYHKATEKATAFSRWLDDQDLTPEQKQVVKESFTFYSQISQDSKRYDELVAAGLSEDTAYELAASLSGLTAEEGAKSVTDQQKYQAIIDAGLSAKETDKAFSAIMTESKYAKWQDCSAAGITAKEFVAVNGQYTAINKEDLKASQKATEFAHWLDGQSFSEDEKAVLEDSFGFYSQIRQDAKYDEFTAAGLDKDTAYAVTQGILALEPEEGADSVSSLQKWQVVADSDMSESQKMQAMSVLMTDAEYAKLETGSSYGVTVDAYYLFKKTLPTYDADGNGSFKQEEVEAALDSLCGNGGLVLPSVDTAVTTLTVAQCAALWQMANKSWKPKNNPFSKTVGAQVYEALNAGADSGDEVEIVIPTLTEDGGIVLPSVG